eukprot:TRINITY_DN74955_c0_g1_i1.p1 TRINITY_DN74955_c0_g1~~TRINITY_DN74955_c0_g1_i1.p1  ORF type:complete len:286 (+),score=22.37 TRINITY_DN74955_c0_g1_i1:54-911(+)
MKVETPTPTDTPKLKGTGTLNFKETKEELFAKLKPEEIEALHKFREAEPELTHDRTDRFLIYCLVTRKLEIPAATTLLKNYMLFEQKYELDKIDPANIRKLVDDGFIQWPAGGLDKEGSGVAYLFPTQFKGPYPLKQQVQFSFYLINLMYEQDLNVARNGLLYVEDFAGCSFSQLMAMSKSVDSTAMKELMSGMETSVPVRLRGIVLYHAPWWIRAAVAIFKPFLAAETKQKLSVMTPEQLKARVSEDVLLKQCGGKKEFDLKAWAVDHFGDKTPGEPSSEIKAT